MKKVCERCPSKNSKCFGKVRTCSECGKDRCAKFNMGCQVCGTIICRVHGRCRSWVIFQDRKFIACLPCSLKLHGLGKDSVSVNSCCTCKQMEAEWACTNCENKFCRKCKRKCIKCLRYFCEGCTSNLGSNASPELYRKCDCC